MSWETLRGALERIRGDSGAPLRIIVSGGEPLLVLPLIGRAVEHVAALDGSEASTRWIVQTNGSLLDRVTVGFLAEHDFEIHLSFDGLPEAQRSRGTGTFERLDDLLRRLLGEDPFLPRDRLTILMTVGPTTVGFMADSFEYFLERGVANISISPVFATPAGTFVDSDGLRRSFERIVELSLAHACAAGEIPLVAFRSVCVPAPVPWRKVSMCGVGHGRSLAIDVDGRLYGCAMLVEGASFQATPWLREELARLCIGGIEDPCLDASIDVFSSRVAESSILANKQEKRSAFARCATCPAISECDLCPVSIGLVPGNEDPNRVPDFACAFYLAGFRAKRRFRASLLAGRPGG